MLKKLKNFCRLTRHSEGFTLVELVVVIAIVAILSGIAVPAYGAYVEKSQKAGDLQLLAAVNKAFAAAVFENGESIDNVDYAELETESPDSAAVFARVRAAASTDESFVVVGVKSITMKNGKNVSPEAITESFKNYYADNMASKFKAIEKPVFNEGVFVDPASSTNFTAVTLPGGGKIYLSDKQISLIQSSTYSEDISGLMDQINGVAGLAAALVGGDGGNNVEAEKIVTALFGDPAYLKGVIQALGGRVNAEDNAEALMNELGRITNEMSDNAVKEQLAKKYGLKVEDIDLDDSNANYFNDIADLRTKTQQEISKNMLVLGVAQNASKQSASNVMDIINSKNPKTELLNAITGKGNYENASSGMGSAALVYGAFTAYANSSSGTSAAKDAITNPDDPTAVFDILEDPTELKKFQDYMKTSQGKTDLDACISSMHVINNTASDKNTVTDILVNGCNNSELVGVLNGLFGTGTN